MLASLRTFAVEVVVGRPSTVHLRCWADLAIATSSVAGQLVVGSARCIATVVVER